MERCAVCNQVRPVVARGRGRGQQAVALCGACSVGVRQPLRYECQGCGETQRIPHPMYRYQDDGPHAFGNNTWACHSGRCLNQPGNNGGFTRWRVVAEDVGRVPPEEAPDSWGRREEWLARVRRQRRLEAATGGRGGGGGGGGGGGVGGGGGAGVGVGTAERAWRRDGVVNDAAAAHAGRELLILVLVVAAIMARYYGMF
jgi:hypothetical protein